MNQHDIVSSFCSLFRAAGIGVEHRTFVACEVLRHCLRLSTYRERRKEIREIIGEAQEQAVCDFVRPLRTSYFSNVILWRVLYCAVETQDVASAALRYGMAPGDLHWIISMFSGSDDLAHISKFAPAHWSVRPLPEREVQDIVKHGCVQKTIAQSLRYNKSGIIWHHDRAIEEQDLRSDLECHACATVLRYESCRRSRWHLINSVNRAIGNYINNILRTSTSLESGHMVSSSRLSGGKRGERQSDEISVQRIVPLTITNEDGDSIDQQAAIADTSFAAHVSVAHTIKMLEDELPRNLIDYLKVTALNEHNEDFESWAKEQDKDLSENRRSSIDLIFKQAATYFKVTKKDMLTMQEAIRA